ncbi:PTS sugar transporter subunit IIB [Clostridia bacterium]|nr:PTS sugar transporter subunit IIB [Clostridia bacterium]
MKKILLVCSAGMSTSLLVSKMEKVAAEKGIESKIWAISASVIDSNLDEADVVLLGPQVKFMLKNLKEKTDAKGIPIDCINMQDYGMCNGEKVLDFALGLIG